MSSSATSCRIPSILRYLKRQLYLSKSSINPSLSRSNGAKSAPGVGCSVGLETRAVGCGGSVAGSCAGSRQSWPWAPISGVNWPTAASKDILWLPLIRRNRGPPSRRTPGLPKSRQLSPEPADTDHDAFVHFPDIGRGC